MKYKQMQKGVAKGKTAIIPFKKLKPEKPKNFMKLKCQKSTKPKPKTQDRCLGC